VKYIDIGMHGTMIKKIFTVVFDLLYLKVAKRGFIQHCSLKKPIVLLPPDEVPSFISRGAITSSGARALC
jgi:hypothetical protein